jgi:hypothetical protein
MKTFTRLLQSLVIAFLSILVFFNQAQSQTGTLTGVVRNCYNNLPIPGASVMCGAFVANTNASGVYTIVNLPAGNYTASASAVGFMTKSLPCVIQANQTTVLNFCLDPVSGIITGVITNCVTGDPVVGVRITFGTLVTYSVAGGNYSLRVYPGGTNVLTFTKPGFSNYTFGPVTVYPPSVVTVNVQFKPALDPPSQATAVLNGTQTATDISWATPGSPVELLYDDGTPEQCTQYLASGDISAVRFTPCGYPAVVRKINLSVCGTPANFAAFTVSVYSDDGPGGMPGSVLAGPFTMNPTATGWATLNLPSPITLTTGNFYVGMAQGGGYPNCTGLSTDTSTTQLRSFQKTTAGPWVPVSGNYMIRAVVDEPCGLVPPANITYTVSRLKQGQESTPTAWTLVGTVTGSNTMTDGSWGSLPCRPYRWAVNASYPCNGLTAAKFTNVIGKCWTATVTIHGQRCCTGGANMVIRLYNQDYPDTTYYAVTDSTGTAVVSNVWKGHYKFDGNVFGCYQEFTYATINGDTTVNVILHYGVALAPQGISVNEQTLQANWDKPRFSYSLFSESWAGGNFTSNQWTTSGGSNWQISTGIGYPASSAMFNWTPQVSGYDQYLTSKSISPGESDVLKLSYDIFLDNYGTNTVNSMSVEIWDGTSWSVLKTFDNTGGSIPWTHNVITINNFNPSSFKIRFHASGGDSYDINNWNIDNITITGLQDPPCLTGYNVYFNSVLGAFVADTTCPIPPSQVIYGHHDTACVVAVYNYVTPAGSSPTCTTFISHFLYPPLNFTGDSIECAAFLNWQKPQLLYGGTPPGLMGYNIYRDTGFVHYCPSPDSLSYVDMDLDPGNYLYSCTARYDLSVFGLPGQFDESLPEYAMDSVYIACGIPVPFHEGWDQGNFTYSGWTFEPTQGNWDVTSVTGNPSPTADFSWSGKKKTVNYDYSLVSPAIDASQWDCSHLYLSFDIRLIDNLSTSTELMTVELLYDNAWHIVADYGNNGSFGWNNEIVNIDPARGRGIKIRFRAHGQNSANILHWYIDNISIYGVCLPPESLQWTAGGAQVSLNWTAPCNSVSGYNVFRSDSSGNPPFTRINEIPVTGTSFTDVPPGWSQDDIYAYYVTALQTDITNGVVLCESGASDTVLVAFPTGIPETGTGVFRIYPNPAGDWMIIRSDQPFTRVQVMSNLGTMVYTGLYAGETQIRMDTGGFPEGIWFIRLSARSGTYYGKFIIRR